MGSDDSRVNPPSPIGPVSPLFWQEENLDFFTREVLNPLAHQIQRAPLSWPESIVKPSLVTHTLNEVASWLLLGIEYNVLPLAALDRYEDRFGSFRRTTSFDVLKWVTAVWMGVPSPATEHTGLESLTPAGATAVRSFLRTHFVYLPRLIVDQDVWRCQALMYCASLFPELPPEPLTLDSPPSSWTITAVLEKLTNRWRSSDISPELLLCRSPFRTSRMHTFSGFCSLTKYMQLAAIHNDRIIELPIDSRRKTQIREHIRNAQRWRADITENQLSERVKAISDALALKISDILVRALSLDETAETLASRFVSIVQHWATFGIRTRTASA